MKHNETVGHRQKNDKTITWLTVVSYKQHLCKQFCYLKEKPVTTTKYAPMCVWKEEVYLPEWGALPGFQTL